MSAPVNSGKGNYPDPTTAVYVPAIDVPFGSITASYTTFKTLIATSAILVLSNYTNEMVDYTLSGGVSTQGHLSAGQVLVLNMKSNKVPGSGSTSVGFQANAALPTSGFCSVTYIAPQ